jgi:hypothetical protein
VESVPEAWWDYWDEMLAKVGAVYYVAESFILVLS